MLSAVTVLACNSDESLNYTFSSISQPIINGKQVTGKDRLSTVSLYLGSGKKGDIICSGTLISPNYILTAGHCVSDCEGKDKHMDEYRLIMRVGFGQNEKEFIASYIPEEYIPHPDFVCTTDTIKNDIALVRLKESVPREIASPSLIIPPALAITADEVDSTELKGTSVGFGMTIPGDDKSSGTKYETTRPFTAFCPLSESEKSSQKCSSFGKNTKGFLFMYDENSNVCSGDSGGPTFIARDDMEYIVGVASWVTDKCNGFSGMTDVNTYRSFIEKYVKDLAAQTPEICNNNKDDNGDKRVDCDDPYCYHLTECAVEICDNDIDDNEDGHKDCDDSQCAGHLRCQPEICDNDKDDNGDELKDCDDPQCEKTPVCVPEICDNNKDDNGDDLKDCDDPQCKPQIICQPEICNNNKDDNGNGLIDCDDPQCEDQAVCQPEICDNSLDDNGDGLVDCDDPQCANDHPSCLPEICDNEKDDNNDNLIDCDDPKCASDSHCASPQEDIIPPTPVQPGPEEPAPQDPVPSTPTPTPTPTPVTPQQPATPTTPVTPPAQQTPGNGTLTVDCSDPYWQSQQVCSEHDDHTGCSISSNPPQTSLSVVFLAFLGILGIRSKRRKD